VAASTIKEDKPSQRSPPPSAFSLRTVILTDFQDTFSLPQGILIDYFMNQRIGRLRALVLSALTPETG
jgi:hypothetical protein